MKIYLNEKEIQADEAENLKDLIQNIVKKLYKENLIITQVKINDNIENNIFSEEMAKIKIDDKIQKIDIKAEDISVLSFHLLGEAGEYFGRIIKCKNIINDLSKEKNEGQLKQYLDQLIEGLPYILQLLAGVIKNLKVDLTQVNNKKSWFNILKELKKIIEEIKQSDLEQRVKLYNEVLVDLSEEIILSLKNLVETVNIDTGDTEKISKDAMIELIQTIKEKIEKGVEKLQQGNFQEGMMIISEITASLEKCLVIADKFFMSKEKIKEEIKKEYKEIIEKVLGFLKEILTAFENQDTVLISDLLEYEIIDLLDNLKKLIEQV